MPNLVPSNNGGLGKALVRKVAPDLTNYMESRALAKQGRKVVSVDASGRKWTINDMQQWLIDHDGELPPHMQPGYNADGKNVELHYHEVVATTEPVKSGGHVAAEVAGQVAVTLIQVMGQVLIATLKTIGTVAGALATKSANKPPPPPPQQPQIHYHHSSDAGLILAAIVLLALLFGVIGAVSERAVYYHPVMVPVDRSVNWQ